MTMRRRNLLLLLGLLPVTGRAADAPPKARSFSDATFTIHLPEGYLGPVEHVAGSSVSRGFRKPLPSSNLNTVILISVHDMGASFAKRVASERTELTREMLEPVVAGIEKNRTGFRKSQPDAITISGHQGLRVAWSGSAQGVAFEGVVYCVLAGSRAYAVQVQDPSGLGNARFLEALRAVEKMRIAR